MANHHFSYNPTTSTNLNGAPASVSNYATGAPADPFSLLDSSSFAIASRYLPLSKSAAYTAFPASNSVASSLYDYPSTFTAFAGTYAASGVARMGALAGQGLFSGVDASSYQSLSLKRPSEAFYHHNIMGTHNTTGQNDWMAMSYLAKRPRIESSSVLPIYPQRLGEKDCAHYMLTRICKFGEACKFDHPIWVPEGGIPDWKEFPPVAYEDLPKRPGEPDCPYFLKTQRCKFGLNCKFNHPREKEVASVAAGEPTALPERPSEPPCAFYLKTGICKYGASCKFNHPKHVHVPALEQGKVTAEPKSFSTKIEETTRDVKSNTLPTPALVNNSKGLPIRPGELDCPFYLKTGSCKYGSTCRFNHPDRTTSPAVELRIGSGNPTIPALQSFDQLGSAKTVYPQRPGQTECDYYMKSGVCKFGERCKFHHPIDRSAPSTKAQETVKLTGAGYPRREGALACPHYMKTSACKYGATCKFDHPPPAEVLAMAAAQATSTATESEEDKDGED